MVEGVTRAETLGPVVHAPLVLWRITLPKTVTCYRAKRLANVCAFAQVNPALEFAVPAEARVLYICCTDHNLQEVLTMIGSAD